VPTAERADAKPPAYVIVVKSHAADAARFFGLAVPPPTLRQNNFFNAWQDTGLYISPMAEQIRGYPFPDVVATGVQSPSASGGLYGSHWQSLLFGQVDQDVSTTNMPVPALTMFNNQIGTGS